MNSDILSQGFWFQSGILKLSQFKVLYIYIIKASCTFIKISNKWRWRWSIFRCSNVGSEMKRFGEKQEIRSERKPLFYWNSIYNKCLMSCYTKSVNTWHQLMNIWFILVKALDALSLRQQWTVEISRGLHHPRYVIT